jgi:hypothetical protein
MFGMLDYRAHKLFWLINLPFRIAGRVCFFIIIAIAIFIARWTEFNPWIQIVIGYVAFEGMALVFIILWLLLIMWPIDGVFFWTVDVIPSRGENIEEAKEIVRRGPAVWLVKKMENHIEDWTFEDQNEFVKCMNWRARLFFDGKNKTWKRVRALQDAHEKTGKQPAELGVAEVKKLLKPYKDDWFETVIISPHGWNAILGGVIIVLAIWYLSSQVG